MNLIRLGASVRHYNVSQKAIMTSMRLVDLRSDTLTKPTMEMRNAMFAANVGDDVYDEDPTVKKLECIAADMLGKERGLFVPTGTMGNLIAVMCHCTTRGSQVVLGNKSHVFLNEQVGMSQFGGISTKTMDNASDGTFCLEELKRDYQDGKNFHHAKTSLICIENAMNGSVLPMSFMAKLRTVANDLDLPIHLDGARLLNASTYLKVPPTEITKYVDTVCVCLSKGLGAPVGSVIVGNSDFIEKCKYTRKALGGGMRQSGILAAAGIIALTESPKRLHVDHENALFFAKNISKVAPNLVQVDTSLVHTNMVMLSVNQNIETHSENTPSQELVHLLNQPISGLETDVIVSTLAFSSTLVRVAFYDGITRNDVECVLQKFSYLEKSIKINS